VSFSNQKLEIECNECGEKLKIPKDAITGEILRCKCCGIEFELVIEGERASLKIADAILEDFGE